MTSSQEARIAATEAAMEAALEASWASGSGSPVAARPATVLDSLYYTRGAASVGAKA